VKEQKFRILGETDEDEATDAKKSPDGKPASDAK
jgi:hypothetical protein